MNQVRAVTPGLSFGTKLMTYDENFQTKEPRYGPMVNESINPFFNARDGVALLFDSFKGKPTRTSMPDRLTEFEATQLLALLHAKQGKVRSLQDILPLNPQWQREMIKILHQTELAQLLGTNGHSGIEQRYLSRLFYQFANMTIYIWMKENDWIVDVQSATIDEVEVHVSRMADVNVQIPSFGVLKTAVIAVMNICLHSLVCSTCHLGDRCVEVVSRLMNQLDRTVMLEPAACGAPHLAVHTEFPGVTSINVPLRWRHLKVFDAPERRNARDNNPGIGMRSVPIGFNHLIAYESIDEADICEYYHIDIGPTVPFDTPETGLFKLNLTDAHTHVWVSNQQRVLIPIPSTNPVIKAVLQACAGEHLESIHFTVPLLSFIDAVTSLAIRIKNFTNTTGAIAVEQWTESTLREIDTMFVTSKFPNYTSVRKGMKWIGSREQEIIWFLVKALIAGVTAITDVSKWEFTQKYVTYQVDCVKSGNVLYKNTDTQMDKYFQLILSMCTN